MDMTGNHFRDDDDAIDFVAGGLDTVGQAAAYLGFSRSHLYALMERGHLPYVKIGKARRVPHRAVLELAARNLVRE
jgi:excisionase family DNA binding protein